MPGMELSFTYLTSFNQLYLMATIAGPGFAGEKSQVQL